MDYSSCGLTDKESENVYDALCNNALEAIDKENYSGAINFYEEALKIKPSQIQIMGELCFCYCQENLIYFYDLKNLCVLIEEDRKDLDALIYQESNKDVLFYAWGDNPNKKSIKTDDSSIIINNDKIIYYNQIIKYKFSKLDNNGSTLSVICKHSKGPIQIKIPNKEFSEKLKDMLMKKVATLLTFDYLDLLREGNELQFGKLVFNDYGIKLPGKSFFINNTKSFTWNEIKDISFENNEITIIGPGSYRISESLDADYNLEVLKLMLIVFKSRGLCGRFSENL